MIRNCNFFGFERLCFRWFFRRLSVFASFESSSGPSGKIERKMTVEEGDVDKKIIVGVCVMEKKVKCGSEVFIFFA